MMGKGKLSSSSINKRHNRIDGSVVDNKIGCDGLKQEIMDSRQQIAGPHLTKEGLGDN